MDFVHAARSRTVATPRTVCTAFEEEKQLRYTAPYFIHLNGHQWPSLMLFFYRIVKEMLLNN